jgi:hypothetical protein
VSDTPLPSVGISDAQITDQSVQREWDRFAAPQGSDGTESLPSPRALSRGGSTRATLALRVFDSAPAYDSTTALGDAFAKAQTGDPAEEDANVPSETDGRNHE